MQPGDERRRREQRYSGSGVTDNGVSENDVSDNGVTENDVTENDVTENDVTGSGIAQRRREKRRRETESTTAREPSDVGDHRHPTTEKTRNDRTTERTTERTAELQDDNETTKPARPFPGKGTKPDQPGAEQHSRKRPSEGVS
ncbi:hypothetical protein [Rhodovulum sp. PH10]|uniref:hypothetical protein n=1 Tax=Rhodovulum sp. PH10 TaxID=1187851 RepID=UPI0012F78A20|nr:hypothetical protein [Rhodovulum sp. PH10]